MPILQELKQKEMGLPIWGWAAIVAGLIFFVMWRKRASKVNAATDQINQNALNESSIVPPSYFPSIDQAPTLDAATMVQPSSAPDWWDTPPSWWNPQVEPGIGADCHNTRDCPSRSGYKAHCRKKKCEYTGPPPEITIFQPPADVIQQGSDSSPVMSAVSRIKIGTNSISSSTLPTMNKRSSLGMNFAGFPMQGR